MNAWRATVKMTWVVAMAAVALVAAGCDGATDGGDGAGTAADGATAGADTGTSGGGDGADAGGGTADDATGAGGADGVGVTDDPADGSTAGDDASTATGPSGLLVGDTACCLAMEADRVVWAEDGDLWLWEPATGERSLLVGAPGDQRDPALSGDRLVWADARGGDYDLWMLDLASGDERPLVEAPGDQTWPTLDGDRLAWVDRRVAPHGDREADIWFMDVTDADSPRALLVDSAQQDHPHLRGHRVVWDDFSADPDGQYRDLADPAENNGDIVGYDLETDTIFIVTNDASKQQRPAIDGENVVWLDWRGISPEPKYSEFQVFTRRVGVDLVATEEIFLAWSSWDVPALWQRPSVADGQVAFIANVVDDEALQTGVFVAPLDGTPAERVAGSGGVLESVALHAGRVAWLGAGELGISELPQMRQD